MLLSKGVTWPIRVTCITLVRHGFMFIKDVVGSDFFARNDLCWPRAICRMRMLRSQRRSSLWSQPTDIAQEYVQAPLRMTLTRSIFKATRRTLVNMLDSDIVEISASSAISWLLVLRGATA